MVVSLMDFGVPKNICCAVVVQKLKAVLLLPLREQIYFKMLLVEGLLAQLGWTVPRKSATREGVQKQ